MAHKNLSSGCLLLALVFLGCEHASNPDTPPKTPISETVCLGPQNATELIVYFHGMDSLKPSGQEENNRTILENIANQHGLRIALARSTRTCPEHPDALCWIWGEWDANILTHRINAAIQQAKQACAPQANSTGLLGFSNGGVLLGRIVQQCLQVQRDWIVTVGAPGSWGADTDSLSVCGAISMMMGTSDVHNRPSGQKLFEHLKGRDAAATWVDFKGGHNLDKKSLEKALLRTAGESKNLK